MPTDSGVSDDSIMDSYGNIIVHSKLKSVNPSLMISRFLGLSKSRQIKILERLGLMGPDDGRVFYQADIRAHGNLIKYYFQTIVEKNLRAAMWEMCLAEDETMAKEFNGYRNPFALLDDCPVCQNHRLVPNTTTYCPLCARPPKMYTFDVTVTHEETRMPAGTITLSEDAFVALSKAGGVVLSTNIEKMQDGEMRTEKFQTHLSHYKYTLEREHDSP